MRGSNDWRLTNQLSYLKGATLEWRRYSRFSDSWDHDHCEFCSIKFGNSEDRGDHPGILRVGYSTPDGYRWVCKTCFEDFRDLFGWQVERA